jgi:diadenosine tetraphosphate (Ap4A) HIT family hydrolase
MNDCIFCKIVKGEVPSHKIWESDTHLAFLTVFPNTEGFSVVIPKKHFSSYFVEMPENDLTELIKAAVIVAKKIDAAFDDVGRTGMIFEGFGVDHVHAKLFPMHGTADMKNWKPVASKINKYFEKYEGYISSHDSDRADDQILAKIAEKIRESI